MKSEWAFARVLELVGVALGTVRADVVNLVGLLGLAGDIFGEVRGHAARGLVSRLPDDAQRTTT
jgi:hypothetical protein